MSHAEPTTRVATVGEVVDKVSVTIGPQFLALFSEHLYSSPNKAFEELVSNSWDAGAETVYIGVPENLAQPSAVVWVLDDGESMDLAGLHALWAVATSSKRLISPSNARPQIGKFGIGKLATYILADEVTYVCKAADGIIRAVTMDYRRINEGAAGKLNRSAVDLSVRILEGDQLRDLLCNAVDGQDLLDLIQRRVPRHRAMER